MNNTTKEKGNILVGVLKIIGAIVVIGVIGFFLFNQFAPDDVKKEFYESVGVDNPAVTDYTVYVEIEGECVKGLLGKKWQAAGVVWSTHTEKAFNQITIRFHFSDGYEDETIYKDLSPNNVVHKKPWTVSISGHKNATFNYMEVVDVK